MSDRFDFRTAQKLVELVENAASKLDVQNGQMEARFGRLHEFFKDEGYDVFVPDMSSADKAIADVISQMHLVSKALSEYAARLYEISRS